MNSYEKARDMVGDLADFITVEIRKRGMTTREFAKFAGVSQPTISRILNNPEYGRTMKAKTLAKIAKALGVRPEVLERLAKKDLLRDEEVEVRVLVELIKGLDKEDRRMIEAMLRGFNEANSKGAL